MRQPTRRNRKDYLALLWLIPIIPVLLLVVALFVPMEVALLWESLAHHSRLLAWVGVVVFLTIAGVCGLVYYSHYDA